MAGQHFTSNLCVTWLVGPDEADDLQPGEEEKSAKGDQSQQIRGAAGSRLKTRGGGQLGIGGSDGYCTLSEEVRLS